MFIRNFSKILNAAVAFLTVSMYLQVIRYLYFPVCNVLASNAVSVCTCQ